MIDYAQIRTEAAELARQFWAEIEEELAQQRNALSAALPSTHKLPAVEARVEALPPYLLPSIIDGFRTFEPDRIRL